MHFATAIFVDSARHGPRQVVIHTCKGRNDAGGKNRVVCMIVVKWPSAALESLHVAPLRDALSALHLSHFTYNKIYDLTQDTP
jgi:hypothetical protein